MALILCPDCHREHSDAAPACPGCGRPAPPKQSNLPTPSHAFPESNLAGEILAGKYRLEKLVGRGGMASVYKAMRVDLQMPVAIKIISPQVAEEEDFAERFVREARIQFSLQHQGIVRVFDLLRDRGWLGLAMDWIEGDNLLQFLRRQKKPLSPEQIVGLFIPILDAIAFAHEHKIIHRDLKPGNILLHEQSGGIVPKLTDFGIAKVMGEGADHQTLSHLSLGTPTYMSPEQIEGARDIDHRTDIYSLGVLLFRMVAGKPPFKGPTAMATSMAHLRDAVPHVQAKFEAADPRFDAIIQAAMAKLPGDRFPDCASFAIALKLATNDPRPLPASLQKATTSRQTAVDLDMGWMSSFARPPQETKPAPQPPHAGEELSPFQHDPQGKTEISGPQVRQEWAKEQANQRMGTPADTGEMPVYIAAEDAQGSTGELIRQATGELPALQGGWQGRSSLRWVAALVGLVVFVVIGAWWGLSGPATVTPSAALKLSSQPPGAQVIVGGRQIGKTPIKVQPSKEKKPLVIQLRHPKFMPHTLEWRGRKSSREHIVLRPFLFRVLKTKPPGAAVIIDGKRLGVTPYKLLSPPGVTHSIQLEKKGFVPRKLLWKATQNVPNPESINLAPKFWE